MNREEFYSRALDLLTRAAFGDAEAGNGALQLLKEHTTRPERRPNCKVCALPHAVHAEAYNILDGSIQGCAARVGGDKSKCLCAGLCPPQPHAYVPYVIDDFRGVHRYLSNFHVCDVVMHGWVFPSSEHAYQAMKAADPATWWPRFADRNLSCKDARKLGQQIPLRVDWESVKVAYMRSIIWDKFTRHVELREKLCATDPAMLVEGNTWQDRFWGVCDGVGENWLGRILMETREALWRPPF